MDSKRKNTGLFLTQNKKKEAGKRKREAKNKGNASRPARMAEERTLISRAGLQLAAILQIRIIRSAKMTSPLMLL